MLINQVICDQCGKECGSSDSHPGYYIELRSLAKKINSEMMHAIYVRPQFEHDLHFCNKVCFKAWVWDNMADVKGL